MAAQQVGASFFGASVIGVAPKLTQRAGALFSGAGVVGVATKLAQQVGVLFSGVGVVGVATKMTQQVGVLFSGVGVVAGNATKMSAIALPPLSPQPPVPPSPHLDWEDRDRHIRRSGSDYTQSFLTLLPQGQAWPREPGSTLSRVVDGLCQFYGFVDGRAADLLETESDPRITFELLPDWEKAWGLPDPCFPSATTIAERQLMLVLFMTWIGGQSRQYFINLMAWLGYPGVEIQEFAPFMCGISWVGDTRTVEDAEAGRHFRWYIGPPEQRFYWTIEIGQVGLNWFRAASGQAGVHHHLEFAVPEELVCLIQRWKPAHTSLIPDFSALAYGGPMQGTP